MKSEERRQFERIDEKSSIRYRKVESATESGVMLHGTMLDCSGGGVRFETDQPCEKRCQLLMELEFDGWLEQDEERVLPGLRDDSGRRQILGAVMWCQENQEKHGMFELGVRFTGMVK